MSSLSHSNPFPSQLFQVGRLLKDHFRASGSLQVQPDQGMSMRDDESDSSDSGLEGIAF